MSDTTLHNDIHHLVHLKPIEDLILQILRPQLTDVRVQTLLDDEQTFPVVLVRANGDWGVWSGDTRFIDTAQLNIHVYCDGLNADEDAALLSEAVRAVFTSAINRVYHGLGHLTRADLVSRPRRVADWASSTGPVQYADLPTGVIRYESIYEIAVRRPL